jgi:site-specific DNA-methyltransferase (adenine-specific)
MILSESPRIEIIHGDCMDYMDGLEPKAFQLAIVDPPYGINININMGRRKGDRPSNYHKFAGNDTKIPDALYFNELFRVSGNQIVWGGNYMTEHLPPSSCWFMWDKGFSADVTFAQFELAWSSFTSSAKKFDMHPNQLDRIHPTQKPIKLYRWLLQNYANPGDRILDTHLGSGSSAIACYEEGFDFVGIELDKDYYDAAVKRFRQHIAQGSLF